MDFSGFSTHSPFLPTVGNPPRLTCPQLKAMQVSLTKQERPTSNILIALTRGCKVGMHTRNSTWLPIPIGTMNWPLIAIKHKSLIVDGPLFIQARMANAIKIFHALSWVPETFLAGFSVFVVASAHGRRCVSLRSTPKIPTGGEKNLWYPE